MKTPTTKTPGPFADSARAAEIASMDTFGLLEFTELTGVGAGDYGTYRVSTAGVSLILALHFNEMELSKRSAEGQPVGPRVAGDSQHKDMELSNWTPEEQLVIQRAALAPALTFPCSPEGFMSWYDAIRGPDGAGEFAASDFPLAQAFEKAVRRSEGSSSDRKRFSCTSQEIAAAFAVKTEPAKNAAWWADRLGDPAKYGKQSLVGARASKGNPRNPSRWYPDVVAGWLLEKEYLPPSAVINAMQRAFPAVEFDPVIPGD